MYAGAPAAELTAAVANICAERISQMQNSFDILAESSIGFGSDRRLSMCHTTSHRRPNTLTTKATNGAALAANLPYGAEGHAVHESSVLWKYRGPH